MTDIRLEKLTISFKLIIPRETSGNLVYKGCNGTGQMHSVLVRVI